MVRFALIKKLFIAIFFVIIGLALCSLLILDMHSVGFALLLADFIVAGFVAIFASLQVREEEEEKLFK